MEFLYNESSIFFVVSHFAIVVRQSKSILQTNDKWLPLLYILFEQRHTDTIRAAWPKCAQTTRQVCYTSTSTNQTLTFQLSQPLHPQVIQLYVNVSRIPSDYCNCNVIYFTAVFSVVVQTHMHMNGWPRFYNASAHSRKTNEMVGSCDVNSNWENNRSQNSTTKNKYL